MAITKKAAIGHIRRSAAGGRTDRRCFVIAGA
jgi:hypothetical protein